MDSNKLLIICIFTILIVGVACAAAVSHVQKTDTSILMESATELSDSDTFSVRLVDREGSPLSGKPVEIKGLTKEPLNLTTDDDGMVNFNLEDSADGTYNVVCTFYGDDGYRDSVLESVVTIRHSGPSYPADWYEGYHWSDYEIHSISGSTQLATFEELTLMEAPDGRLWLMAGDGCYEFIE